MVGRGGRRQVTPSVLIGPGGQQVGWLVSLPDAGVRYGGSADPGGTSADRQPKFCDITAVPAPVNTEPASTQAYIPVTSVVDPGG